MNHVELVYLLGIVLGLGVVLPTALLSLSAQFLDQFFGAVVKRQHRVRHLRGSESLRWAREAQLAQDLTPDRLHALFLYVVNVHGGASGQREDRGHAVEEEEKQKCFAQMHDSHLSEMQVPVPVQFKMSYTIW